MLDAEMANISMSIPTFLSLVQIGIFLFLFPQNYKKPPLFPLSHYLVLPSPCLSPPPLPLPVRYFLFFL